ncbi:hypothetical protein BGZ99_000914, partial [Dissophora globulifera]
FCYIESGRQFRAVSTSFWLLASSLGSIWILILEPPFVASGISNSTKDWAYSGIGMFGCAMYCVIAYFYVPRKIRPSINEAARVAKEAEYSLAQY